MPRPFATVVVVEDPIVAKRAGRLAGAKRRRRAAPDSHQLSPPARFAGFAPARLGRGFFSAVGAVHTDFIGSAMGGLSASPEKSRKCRAFVRAKV